MKSNILIMTTPRTAGTYLFHALSALYNMQADQFFCNEFDITYNKKIWDEPFNGYDKLAKYDINRRNYEIEKKIEILSNNFHVSKHHYPYFKNLLSKNEWESFRKINYDKRIFLYRKNLIDLAKSHCLAKMTHIWQGNAVTNEYKNKEYEISHTMLIDTLTQAIDDLEIHVDNELKISYNKVIAYEDLTFDPTCDVKKIVGQTIISNIKDIKTKMPAKKIINEEQINHWALSYIKTRKLRNISINNCGIVKDVPVQENKNL